MNGFSICAVQPLCQGSVILACQAVDLWDQDNGQSREVSEQQSLKQPGGNPSVNQLS